MNQPMPQQAAESAPKSRSPKDMLVDGQSSAAELAKILGSNEGTQAEAQLAGQIAAMYEQLAEALTSPQGGAPRPDQPPRQSGPAPMESGANPNARPV